MKNYKDMVSTLNNKDLLETWTTLDKKIDSKEIEIAEATVRGWLMDEIEKRFPIEFDLWIENCMEDDNLENYIKI